MPRLFRKSFLLHMSEEADDLALPVPDRHVPLFWPTLFTVAFALAALSAWLFTARLPVTVEARGIVLPIGGVREITSLGQGTVTGRPDAARTRIRAGDILLRVSNPPARAAYEDARRRYLAETSLLEAQKQDGLRNHDEQIKALDDRLHSVLAKRARLRSMAVSFESAAALSHSRSERERMQHALSDINQKIDASHAEEQRILNPLESAKGRWEIDRMELELRALASRSALLNAERQRWMGENIVSPYEGELIAMKKAPGQLVGQGEPVALVNLVPQHQGMLMVISPRARRGQITLAVVDRAMTIEYGEDDTDFESELHEAIRNLAPGVVFDLRIADERAVITAAGNGLGVLERLELSQTELFDDANVPVFADLIPIGDEWRGSGLVAVALLQPQDAKRVQVGDRALVKPGFEKSLIGSQIEARVTYVSDYIATSIEAQALVGSAELAQMLTGSHAGIVANLGFERDPDGALRLDGDTLSRPLSVGTMVTTRIWVEVTSPIAVLLPFYADFFNQG